MRLAASALTLVASAIVSAASPATLTIEIRDVAALPITGKLDGTGQVDGMLARVNSIREEPGGTGRLFITDMNGPVYILDKKTKAITTYLDFNGRDDRPGLFDKLFYEAGYSSGVSQFQFDPDYRTNGRFYTVHMESPAIPGSQRPDTSSLPGLKLGTIRVRTHGRHRDAGPIQYESILIEWTDTNLRNVTFEGTAREIMRVQFNGRIHPMGEIVFHPAARRGRPRVAGDVHRRRRRRRRRIANGDPSESATAGHGGREDSAHHSRSPASTRETSTVSENGRYRIPERQPVRCRSRAHERKSGRTVFAIRTG